MADGTQSSDEEALLLAAAALIIRRRLRRKSRKRRYWVHPRLDKREPFDSSTPHHLEQSFPDAGSDLRMEARHFEFLQQRVAALLPDRQDTFMRKCLSKRERLDQTLKFLASGENYTSFSHRYRISRVTLGRVVPETCAAICTALKEFVQPPTSEDDWIAIAKDFEVLHHFPNCLGAVDGKHIFLRNCAGGSSKQQQHHVHSLIILAIVDAHRRFRVFDLGVNPKKNDSGVFSSSPLATLLQDNHARSLPPPRIPPTLNRDTTPPLPHVAVAGDTFSLKPYLMKPYPQRRIAAEPEEQAFNFRLGQVVRAAEDAFEILVNRFAVLGKQMNVQADVATVVVQACIALHNWLRTEGDARYREAVPRDVQHGWYKDLGKQMGNRCANAALTARNQFRDYFRSLQEEGGMEAVWELDD